MLDLEHRLSAAIEHFGSDRDPRTIEPGDVRGWTDALGKDGTRSPGTVRHYLNALSGLYGRAQEGLYVDPGYNPVSALVEKPSGWRKSEAAFFEVAEAALLLEAAKVVGARERWNAALGLHAIVATFLLTGGRSSEVLGLDVEDVSFDQKLVRFRENDHRKLKTSTSIRTVPLWPQLRDILQRWIFASDSPPTGLLFTGRNGGMIGDLRKSLDAMGALCGMEPGKVRTRAFRSLSTPVRHSWKSIREQCPVW